MSDRLKAHLALFTVAMIYGLNYTIAKDVMNGYIGPKGFILLRVLGASLLFWIFHAFSGKQWFERKDLWRFMLCGIFGVALNQIMFFEGLHLSTPINAAIIMTSSPIIVLILSAIIFKEALTPLKIAGIILGAAGAIYLIAGQSQVSLLQSDKAIGNLMVMVNAASYSVYLILVKPLMSKYDPLAVIKWVFFFGLLFVLPFGFNQFTEIKWTDMSWVILLETAFVIVFTTFIAYLFNIYAMKTVSSTTVSIYIYLQPVFATLSSFAFGTDLLTIKQFMAAMLIFAGVYLVSFQRRKRVV